MKRTFVILLLIFMVLYGRLGYELYAEYEELESVTSGSLSDIAEEVIVVPLKTFGNDKIERARNVQQEGNNLFLISDNILYRFNRSGELIARITDPEQILVASYLIDPVKRRLIVMGNEDDVYFYSFKGELLNTKKLTDGSGNQRIHTASLFRNRIWTTEECTRFDTDTQTYCIEKQVVEYDLSFKKINSHTLSSAELYSKNNFQSSCNFELGISGDTGKLYAYSPTTEPENLLRDTLLMKHRQIVYGDRMQGYGIAVYPLRFGKRFWISSYQDSTDPSLNYTFCFDQDTCKSWHIQGGFSDNFYHTGTVAQLKPLDIHSNSYYFCKTSEEAKNISSLKKNKTGNAVVFIVSLKA